MTDDGNDRRAERARRAVRAHDARDGRLPPHRGAAHRARRRREWKSVGDVAYVDDEGYVYICDRKKDMIISGGVNIYPGRDRSRALRASRRCSTPRCSASPTTSGASACTRSCRPKPGETIDLDELRGLRRAAPRRYKRPRGYELRDAAAAHRLRQAAEARPARRVLEGSKACRCSGRRCALRYPPPVPTLSEAASKQLLRELRRARARRTDAPQTPTGAVAAAEAIGFPVVVKLCGDAIAHKTERGLVRLGLRDADGGARRRRRSSSRPRAPRTVRSSSSWRRWCRGNRELIAGLVRDPQFGPCVMLGIGGVLAEALGDVTFRVVPALRRRRRRPDRRPPARRALLGPVPRRARGRPRRAASPCSAGSRRSPSERPDVESVDVNPLIVVDGRPVAVDALVELATASNRRRDTPRTRPRVRRRARFRALFEPRGVVVAGASTHPGKFGFVALHNILAAGYSGRGRRDEPRRRAGARRRHGASIDEICPTVRGTSCSCARRRRERRPAPRRGEAGDRAPRSSRAAGYGEAGDDGPPGRSRARRARRRARHPARGPERPGRRVDARALCAQIVAPYPPPGRIAIASQSGNFVSSFQNWAVQTGVGVSRAVSRGQRGRGRRRRLPASTTPTTPRRR